MITHGFLNAASLTGTNILVVISVLTHPRNVLWSHSVLCEKLTLNEDYVNSVITLGDDVWVKDVW